MGMMLLGDVLLGSGHWLLSDVEPVPKLAKPLEPTFSTVWS